MKLCISLLAHDQPDVLTDQLRNFAIYNPTAMVVLHLNPSIGEYVVPSDLPIEVIVNPERFVLQWDVSMVHAHNSNFKYIQSHEFDKFELHASNDLFVKHGRDTNPLEADLNADLKLVPLSNDWNVSSKLRSSTEWNTLLDQFPPAPEYCVYFEGMSFAKSLFKELVTLYDTYMPDFIPLCAMEEMFYPTIARRLTSSVGPSTQFMSFLFSLDDLHRVRSDVIWCDPSFDDGTYEFNMKHRYSVRRITRDMNDPVRTAIRNYSMEME